MTVIVQNRINSSSNIKSPIIDDICELVRSNNNILNLIVDIVSNIYRKLDLNKHKEYIKLVEEDMVETGRLSEKEICEFKDLWKKFEKQSFCGPGITPKIQVGDLLEKLVSDIGPLIIGLKEVTFTVESMLYKELDGETDKSKVKYIKIDGSNKNFDVIFFESYKKDYCKKEGAVLSVEGKVELHECKHDVSGFIPEENMKDKSIKKLIYMQKVHNYYKNENMFICIPTFLRSVEKQKTILEGLNIGDGTCLKFIKIISGGCLVNLLKDKKSRIN